MFLSLHASSKAPVKIWGSFLQKFFSCPNFHKLCDGYVAHMNDSAPPISALALFEGVAKSCCEQHHCLREWAQKRSFPISLHLQ